MTAWQIGSGILVATSLLLAAGTLIVPASGLLEATAGVEPIARASVHRRAPASHAARVEGPSTPDRHLAALIAYSLLRSRATP